MPASQRSVIKASPPEPRKKEQPSALFAAQTTGEEPSFPDARISRKKRIFDLGGIAWNEHCAKRASSETA